MRRQLLTFALAILTIPNLLAQSSPSEQVQVSPPSVRRADPPPANASAEELVKQGDTLRAEKAYLDALDYYRAALKKKPDSPQTYNRAGIAELSMQRFKEAGKDFERHQVGSTVQRRVQQSGRHLLFAKEARKGDQA